MLFIVCMLLYNSLTALTKWQYQSRNLDSLWVRHTMKTILPYVRVLFQLSIFISRGTVEGRIHFDTQLYQVKLLASSAQIT